MSFPVLYLPHGGGPMPLLGDPAQAELTRFLENLGAELPRPRAIIVISAHWEASGPSILADEAPAMLYDYSGFPPESYRITYPAPGAPKIAIKLHNILNYNGFKSTLVTGRGYDHGVFVPLKLIFPQADIPCVQLSLLKGLDAGEHIRLGQALGSLRDEGLMIVGSGMSFHNLQAIFARPDPRFYQASEVFDAWLQGLMTSPDLSPAARLDGLAAWESAPAARFCHPREEHLLPLMVCAGASHGEPATLLFNRPLFGHKVSGFGWGTCQPEIAEFV